MIPYFQQSLLILGPAHLQIWGTCVALGVLLGSYATVCAGRRFGIEQRTGWDLCFWTVCTAFVGAKLWYFFIEWNAARVSLDTFTHGFSLSGGLVCGVVAIVYYARKRNLSLSLAFGSIAYGLPFGMMIGRVGCFLIFDHPGTPTHFLLGQMYVDGIVRHNHGLYLTLASLINVCICVCLWYRAPHLSPRIFVILFLLWYGTSRFFLDFFRATDLSTSDARFFGLTSAQYLAFFMIVIGVCLWYAHRYETQEQKK